MKKIIMGILCGILAFFPIICTAAYVIHLRDGRSFTTSEYREEGDQIKFKRFGGVIGIPKDQVKEIEEVEDLPEAKTAVKPEKPSATEKAEANEDVVIKEEGAKNKTGQEKAADKEKDKPDEDGKEENKKDESKNAINKEVILKEKGRILAEKELIVAAYQHAKRAGDKEEKEKQWKDLLLLEEKLAKIREEVKAANQGRLPPWWNKVR